MTSRAVRLAALALVGLAGLAAGCGIDTRDAGQPSASAITTPTGTTTAPAPGPPRQLPRRPAGTIAVAGHRESSLTRAFSQSVTGVRVNFRGTDDGPALRALCRGEVDVAEVSRAIGPREQRICARYGLRFVGPIEVAADATVVVTWNEHDVGGDCLQLSTVREIFRSASPIDNWAQVGFFNIPLRAAGPDDGEELFQAFASRALGVDDATLADVRGDYRVGPTLDAIRDEVTNRRRRARVDDRYLPEIRRLERADVTRRNREIASAIRRARDRLLAVFAQEDARRAARLVVLTEAQKRRIERDHLRRITRAQDDARDRAIARFTPSARLEHLRRERRARLRQVLHLGNVGIVPFSYYELFEHELRPMEIWDPATARAALQAADVKLTPADPGERPPEPNPGEPLVNPDTTPWCVFPSQLTVTNGSYPLSRPINLYTTETALKRDEVRGFLTSYLNRSQDLAQRNRLVAIPDDLLRDNLEKVNGPTRTTATTTATTTTEVTSTIETNPTSTLPTATAPGGVAGVGSGEGTTTATTTTATTTATTPRTTRTTAP